MRRKKRMAKTTNKTILDNGIRILTKKIDYARSVSMGVWVNAGARDELPNQNGLSHFIEHMIFKGTEKRTAYQIAKEFDAIGGHTNAFTSMEITCYYAKVIDAHLATMVSILSDIFLNSRFEPEEVEKERPVILQEIGMTEDSPEDYIHTIVGKNFWGDNPLGRSILGPRENVISFDSQMIKDFFQRFYQPDQIVISIAGNIEHERIVDLVRTAFETVKRGNGLPERHTPKVNARTTVTEKKLEQIHIGIGCQGLSITSPKRYALSIMNTILGGNMSSRLFQEIRERRGLAYSVYSFISSHADTGMFGVYAGVSPSKAYEATELILDELTKLRMVPVTSSELQGAKEFIKGGILLSSESTDNQMVRLAQNEIYFNRHISLEKIIASIESVTENDILSLAETLIEGCSPAISILGPSSDVEPYEHLANSLS
jgi:predicted Zn-dependent peptidase